MIDYEIINPGTFNNSISIRGEGDIFDTEDMPTINWICHATNRGKYGKIPCPPVSNCLACPYYY